MFQHLDHSETLACRSPEPLDNPANGQWLFLDRQQFEDIQTLFQRWGAVEPIIFRTGSAARFSSPRYCSCPAFVFRPFWARVGTPAISETMWLNTIRLTNGGVSD
jgi:hypothetical protein